MRQYKVEISGVDTSRLISLCESEKRELLRYNKKKFDLLEEKL